MRILPVAFATVFCGCCGCWQPAPQPAPPAPAPAPNIHVEVHPPAQPDIQIPPPPQVQPVIPVNPTRLFIAGYVDGYHGRVVNLSWPAWEYRQGHDLGRYDRHHNAPQRLR